MLESLTPFLLQWALTALALWIASYLFKGLRFEGTGSLLVAALVLGFVNALVRPVLVVLTFPLTLLTLGLFLLVINALMIMLAAALVRGFKVSGFWTAFFASIFISLFSTAAGALVDSASPAPQLQLPQGSGNWL